MHAHGSRSVLMNSSAQVGHVSVLRIDSAACPLAIRGLSSAQYRVIACEEMFRGNPLVACDLLRFTDHWRIVCGLLDRPDEPVGGCKKRPTRSGCSEGARYEKADEARLGDRYRGVVRIHCCARGQ